jgi:predicted dehydrogenase
MKTEINRRRFLRLTGTVAAAAAIAPSIGLLAQDPTQKVVLGFVGCAHIHTPGFINLLKGRNDVIIKSVWDHDEARGKQRANEVKATFVPKVTDVLSDPEIKGVIICSETNRHLPLVLEAAKFKKHMFVEKPLGITAKDSFKMAQAIEDAKVIFTTGYFMRTDPKHIFLKEQLAKNSFGKVTRIRGANCHNGSLGGWFDKEWRWMADPSQAGVGGFGDLGTHSLDIMMWLIGDVDSATASINVVTGRYGTCDESGEGIMKFKNNVVGTLAAGWVDIANPVTLEISGTEGHAVIINGQLFFRSSKVQGADGKKPWEDLPGAPPAPMHQFVNAIKGDKSMPLVNAIEAAKRVAVMEAMYNGSRTGRWVKVQ